MLSSSPKIVRLNKPIDLDASPKQGEMPGIDRTRAAYTLGNP